MPTIVKVDGQDIPLPDGLTDDEVRLALAPYYPGAMNSALTRTQTDETTILEMTKMADPKGSASQVLPVLQRGKAHLNSALVLFGEIMAMDRAEKLTPTVLLTLRHKIISTIEDAKGEASEIELALKRLRASIPCQAPCPPLGF